MRKLDYWQKTDTTQYKYYSFLIGLDDDMPETMYKFDDVKLPALNLKHALRMYRVLKSSKLHLKKVTYDFSVLPMRVQRVVEFEAVKRSGHTVVQYKMLRSVSPYSPI